MTIRGWVGSKLSTTLLATHADPGHYLKCYVCQTKIRLRNSSVTRRTIPDSLKRGPPFQAHLRVRGPGPDRPRVLSIEYVGIYFSRMRRYGYRTRRRKRRRNDCKDIGLGKRTVASVRELHLLSPDH